MEQLFVYGTLAPNRPNAHILEDVKGTWTPATIRGRLIPNGWGAALGYPAVIPDADGDIVKGFLFSSKELNEHWQRLDDFEGEGYERVIVNVSVGDGETQAYVYALNPKELQHAQPAM
ncbi:MAG: gamma-glutamylcyclotransferase [Acinetobacter sp.]|nr:gamma-glutamylcyclotransferase [Acinetobacter sp.]